jgi:hypothetical protein
MKSTQKEGTNEYVDNSHQQDESDDKLPDNVLYVPAGEFDITGGKCSIADVDTARSSNKRLSMEGNYSTVDDDIDEVVSDFTIVYFSQCLTLLLIPFYTVNACLLLVNTKLPPFDQILRKIVPDDAKCGSNNFLLNRYLSLLQYHLRIRPIYFTMKYISNTAMTWMYINKSTTIYFRN